MEDTEHPSITAEEDNSEVPDISDLGRPQPERRRLATLYDAVAGKVNTDQRLQDEGPRQKERLDQRSDQQIRGVRRSTRGTPLAPDEVLFRRKDAPERYAENDVYTSHEKDLPQGGRGVLPDSDLLKSIHAYSSKFYGGLERRQRYSTGATRSVDPRSMDETALLAFGILLEEAGRETLGQRGDLVFTEAADETAYSSGDDVARHASPTVVYQEAGSSSRGGANNARSSKRRRVAKPETPY